MITNNWVIMNFRFCDKRHFGSLVAEACGGCVERKHTLKICNFFVFNAAKPRVNIRISEMTRSDFIWLDITTCGSGTVRSSRVRIHFIKSSVFRSDHVLIRFLSELIWSYLLNEQGKMVICLWLRCHKSILLQCVKCAVGSKLYKIRRDPTELTENIDKFAQFLIENTLCKYIRTLSAKQPNYSMVNAST